MKRPNYVLLQATFVTVILIFASCGNNQQDINVNAEDQNQAILNDNNPERDVEFLAKAVEIDLEEIQLGQLAQQKSGTSHVMELGKMMEDTHSQSLNDLRSLAKSKKITIPGSPTEDAKDAYTKLNEKSGDDFDKSYADMMVQGHKDAIGVYENASKNSNDADIKNWATASLPALKTHLSHSIECQKKCYNNSKINN